MTDYPVKRGWVGIGLPHIGKRRRRLLEALSAPPDLSGGEATAPIAPETIETVLKVLNQHGFRLEALVRMKRRELQRLAEGEDALAPYIAELEKPHGDHFHWPGPTLVCVEPESSSRFVIDADLDASVLELFCWGSRSAPALQDTIEAIWHLMKARGFDDP
ncbi:MAG: hypothetical protein M3198_00300 [Actinomycetota bacterium]|nr:hypothetical protein [Actinomycetota bacterium]